MDQSIVYIACAVAALGMYLLLAMKAGPARLLGVVLGLAGLVWLGLRVAGLATLVDGSPRPEAGDAPEPLFYVFAVLAIAAAVRMVTHHRPVYSALYFVMVVMASASVFLLLQAEFMAFALIIVYAGAILITYLFVIMLAQQAPEIGEEESTPEYDRVPREPAAAVAVGFLMLALLSQVALSDDTPAPASPYAIEADMNELFQAGVLPKKRAALVAAFQQADPNLPAESEIIRLSPDGVAFRMPPRGVETYISIEEAGLSREDFENLLSQNIEQVGMALVHKFPVSLELAGVILLMAMYGAVVLARKQIELSEDEKREAAGMARLSVDADERPDALEGGGA